jgi:hypothetical protein
MAERLLGGVSGDTPLPMTSQGKRLPGLEVLKLTNLATRAALMTLLSHLIEGIGVEEGPVLPVLHSGSCVLRAEVSRKGEQVIKTHKVEFRFWGS